MKNTKKILTSVLFTLVVFFISHFILLTPWNIHSSQFIITLGLLLVGNVMILRSSNIRVGNNYKEFRVADKPTKMVIILVAVVGALIVGINISFSPLFRANTYANRIDIVDESFESAIDPVDYNNLPLLDRASTEQLGDRKMGEIPEFVSQFNVATSYTQINYKEDLVRVTEIDYAGFFKYMANRNSGTPGYIMVNSTTGKADLIQTEKGLRYTPGAYFFEDLNRKIHLTYPTKIFSKPIFEIDEEGNPFYIAPTYKYKGIGLLPDVEGAILVNAITGDTMYYDVADVPNWVDRVYSPELVIDQVNDNGTYNGGFINSIIGQKNVKETTMGYTYLPIDDDIYVYTGITSVQADQSNIGFIISNLRTKETKFIPLSSAEEFSAMNSAEGAIQEKRYVATFPLLVNVNNKPTYLLSLKDQSGLVKAYGLVDVTDHQKVKVTDSSMGIERAAQEYLRLLGEDLIITDDATTKEIEVASISQVTIEGNTSYYISSIDNEYFKVSLGTNDLLPFVKAGDKITVTYQDSAVVNEIIKMDVKA